MTARKKYALTALIAGFVFFILGIVLFTTIYSIADDPNSVTGTIGLATLHLQPMLSGSLCLSSIVLIITGTVLLATNGKKA